MRLIKQLAVLVSGTTQEILILSVNQSVLLTRSVPDTLPVLTNTVLTHVPVCVVTTLPALLPTMYRSVDVIPGTKEMLSRHVAGSQLVSYKDYCKRMIFTLIQLQHQYQQKL